MTAVEGVEDGPCPSEVIEFGANRSTRVVCSSMAADADRRLYNRLLIACCCMGWK